MNFEEVADARPAADGQGETVGSGRQARKRSAAKKKSRRRAKKNGSSVIQHSPQEVTMSTTTNVSSKHLIFRLAPDPSQLWEALVDALYARPDRNQGCQGSSDFCKDLRLQFSDDADQALWDEAEPLARALWLLGRLHECTEVAPEHCCKDCARLKTSDSNPLEVFKVSPSSTYQQLVRSLQLGLR